MLKYETSDETWAALAGRHGTGTERVRGLPAGVANQVFLFGDDLVLRIPRTEQYLPDLVKEAAVIPAARAAGVRTPEVVAFDDTCSVVNVPYMLLTRAPGADLARRELPTSDSDLVARQVGRELARLHRLTPAAAPELRALPADDGAADPWALTERLRRAGWLDAGTARWLTGWFGRLAAHRPAGPSDAAGLSHAADSPSSTDPSHSTDRSPTVLIHGDIAPQNLLVSAQPARLTGIVDWGDAQWADPAADFAKMPLTAVPAMLAGYREENGEPGASSAPVWEARVLWIHLTWALGRLADPVPHPGERHWTAPPPSRLLGLLRFFASGPPAPWNDLV
ncbi:phosphotransferase family protein [Streptomyces sp. NPDC059785]|uniref:phosphotransferase family protein n=1 Tax=Streptomyces sp. NPDC059785 TaxID=3346945 RepID=UPI0036511CF3